MFLFAFIINGNEIGVENSCLSIVFLLYQVLEDHTMVHQSIDDWSIWLGMSRWRQVVWLRWWWLRVQLLSLFFFFLLCSLSTVWSTRRLMYFSNMVLHLKIEFLVRIPTERKVIHQIYDIDIWFFIVIIIELLIDFPLWAKNNWEIIWHKLLISLLAVYLITSTASTSVVTLFDAWSISLKWSFKSAFHFFFTLFRFFHQARALSLDLFFYFTVIIWIEPAVCRLLYFYCKTIRYLSLGTGSLAAIQ